MGSVVTGLGSTGVGTSDSGGDGGSGQPPRDPASGKAPIVEDESALVARPDYVERVEFMPPMGSSSHELIMSSALAEFVGHDRLAQLMREAPQVVEVVVKAREDRLAEIARWNEQERLIREQETAAKAHADLVHEPEVEEEREPGDRAKARLGHTRVKFTPKTYVLPEAHLFVPSGIDIYVPLQDSYDDKLVLRDPLHHISVGWEKVQLVKLLPFCT
ncbi:hypothetical protein RHMOL_Rhmol02G0146600 [Rhododendron molle]|uniref:Uncharacterized protein n=1 Tax=Rhododendron molle TaxID=49168 RepID=A0ACC0PT83_RHOML|nr:hypothetical protein RHMOL_Rhmol02G0146600 [Rhododendron molle]